MKKIYTTITGILLLTTNAYSQWVTQNIGYTDVPTAIYDLEVVDTNVVWSIPSRIDDLGSGLNEFAKTTNGGTSWYRATVGNDTISSISNICALDSSTAWVCKYSVDTAYRGVFKTTDGGATWVHQGAGIMFIGASSWPAFVYFKDANNGIAVGDPDSGYFEIWTTTDGGTNWTRVPSNNIPSPAGDYSLTNSFCHVGDTIWFGSYKGKVYRSVDFGQNWTVSIVTATANTQTSDVYFTNGNLGLARTITTTSFLQKYFRTTDGGLTWNQIPLPSNGIQSDLDGIPNSSIFIATGPGCFYSVDGGSTWVTMYTSPDLQGATGWANGMTGWVGSTADDSLTGGIKKYSSSSSLAVQTITINDKRLRVFPNPSSGDFTMQIDGAEMNGALITVTDIMGNVVFLNTVSNSVTKINETLHLNNLSKGMYYLNITNGSTRFTQKLILE